MATVAVGHVWIPFLLRFCVGELGGAQGPAGRGLASEDGLADAAPHGGRLGRGSLSRRERFPESTPVSPSAPAVAPPNVCRTT